MKSNGVSLLAAVAFFAVVMGSERCQAQVKRIGDTAENFELTNVMTNESVQLSDFEGSIVLLDFFFYW